MNVNVPNRPPAEHRPTRIQGQRSLAWRTMSGNEGHRSSNSSPQCLLAVGFQASFHRYIAKKQSISHRDKKPGKGDSHVDPGPPSCRSLAHTNVLCLPHSLALRLFSETFSLPLILSMLSISATHTHTLTHMLLFQLAARGKWKPATVKCISPGTMRKKAVL